MRWTRNQSASFAGPGSSQIPGVDPGRVFKRGRVMGAEPIAFGYVRRSLRTHC